MGPQGTAEHGLGITISWVDSCPMTDVAAAPGRQDSKPRQDDNGIRICGKRGAILLSHGVRTHHRPLGRSEPNWGTVERGRSCCYLGAAPTDEDDPSRLKPPVSLLRDARSRGDLEVGPGPGWVTIRPMRP